MKSTSPAFSLAHRSIGPISVTIHIPLPPASSADAAATSQFVSAVQDLEALYASSPHFATYVDVHLAMSPLASAPHTAAGSTEGGRQFNVWRNVARLFARTEFVMMLDVDFAVCTDWRSDVRNAVRRIRDGGAASVAGGDGLQGEIVEKLRGGTAALVIPAFEYTKQDDGVDQSTFPRDKQVSSSPFWTCIRLSFCRACCVLPLDLVPSLRCSTPPGARDTTARTTRGTSPLRLARRKSTR